MGVLHPPIFNFLAHLPNINSACQYFIAEKSQGKSYLSANLGQMKPVC